MKALDEHLANLEIRNKKLELKLEKLNETNHRVHEQQTTNVQNIKQQLIENHFLAANAFKGLD